MQRRYLLRGGAVLLSVALHALLLLRVGGAPTAPQLQPVESVTHLSFLQPAIQPVAVPEEVVEPQPEPELKQPEPAIQPKPEPLAKTVKKLVKKLPEPKPEKPKQVQPPQPVVQQVAAQPAPSTPVAPAIDQGQLAQMTERYLSEVMAHIERYKWYPKAARRRGLEGEIVVQFRLHRDGHATHLAVANGPDVLLSAARAAVEKAMPMPSPPAGVDCPLSCEFRMRFSLNAS